MTWYLRLPPQTHNLLLFILFSLELSASFIKCQCWKCERHLSRKLVFLYTFILHKIIPYLHNYRAEEVIKRDILSKKRRGFKVQKNKKKRKLVKKLRNYANIKRDSRECDSTSSLICIAQYKLCTRKSICI